MPAVPERPLTEPAPFALRTEEFRNRLSVLRKPKATLQYTSSNEYQQPLSGAEEETLSDSGFLFKARPAPKHAPFVPQKSTKPLTQLTEPRLKTESRTISRRRFVEYLQKKDAELEQLHEREQAMKENLSKEEIYQLRKGMEFKANPIRHYGDVRPKAILRKVTVPRSPQFMITKRHRLPKS